MKSNIRINRVFIKDVPDLYNFRSLAEQYAYDIFSAYKIIDRIAENSDRLGIDLSAQDRNDLPKLLSAALSDDDKQIRQTAEDIAVDFGRRLGLIIHTLKTASPENQAANSRFGIEDWQPWRNCKKIFLSGGLANGLLGEWIIRTAENILSELGNDDVQLVLTKYPSVLQLIGCARMNRDKNSRALVFDFGQSFVKSGITHFDGDDLLKLNILPKVPSQHMWNAADDETNRLEAIGLHNFIVQTIAERYKANYDGDISSHIVISIAANLKDGSICGRGGNYSKLRLISENYEAYLTRCLTKEIGMSVKVNLLHDGYAAAVCYAGEKDSVLIALGTAFGVGWPEEIPGLKNTEHIEISE